MRAPKTRVVAEIRKEAGVPATRPIDVARRVGAGAGVGILFGVLVAVLSMQRGAHLPLALVVCLILLAACLVPWSVRPRRQADPVPVVVRTLGTDEPVGPRLTGPRRSPSLLVPVVARPLDGSGDFRTVIALKGVDRVRPKDPPVGSLYALQQSEKGFGEIENVPRISQEQLDLIEHLRAHPKAMANNPSVLPIRVGAMDRRGWAQQMQFWLPVLLGGLMALGVIWVVG